MEIRTLPEERIDASLSPVASSPQMMEQPVDVDTASLAATGFQTLLLRIANAVLAGLVGILVARVLGPAGKGLYSLPSIAAALVTSLYTGLSLATSYYMLRVRRGRGALLAASASGILFLVVGTVGVVVIAVATKHLWAALPAALSLPAAAALMIANGYCYGINRVALANVLGLAQTAMILVLMTAGFLVAGAGVWVAIAAWVVGPSLIAAAALYVVVRHSRSLTSAHVPVRDFTTYAAKIGSVNLVSLLNNRADIYIVAAFTSAAALGLYTVAISGAEALLVLTQVVGQVTMPYIGSLAPSDAARFVARCVRTTLIPVVLVAILAALALPVLVRLLFGEPFLAAVPALRVLLIGVAFLYVTGLITNYFTLSLGRPQLSLGIACTSATICIGLSFVLVPRIGIIGGAAASSVAYLIGQVIALTVFRNLSSIGIAQTLWPRRDDFARLYAACMSALVSKKPAALVCGISYFASRAATLLRSVGWGTRLHDTPSGYSRWLTRLVSARTLWSALFVDVVYQLGGPTVPRQLFRLCKLLKRPIVLHWLGSDVLQTVDPAVMARVASQHESDLITDWTCAPWLVDELAPRGLRAQWVPPNIVKNGASSPLPPAPLTVLVYLPDERFDFYGGQMVLSLANRLKGIRFVAVGGTGANLARPENMEFLGWQQDMRPIYERCHVLLRMAQHDGLSFMVTEALSHGRQVIWNYQYPGVVYASSEEDVVRQLLALQDRLMTCGLPFNLEGCVQVQDDFNEAKVRTRVGTALRTVIGK